MPSTTRGPGRTTIPPCMSGSWGIAAPPLGLGERDGRAEGCRGGRWARVAPAEILLPRGAPSGLPSRAGRFQEVSGMRRAIVGYHRDEEGHWVAELGCGHPQHVRHQPPWMERPWVLTPEGRRSRLGMELDCKRCDEEGRVPGT